MFDIAPILDHYSISYTDKSGNQKISCPNPDHEDRDPSCSLHLENGVWYCHGCGKYGSAIDIVMLQEGVKFREAIPIAEGLAGPDDGSVRQVETDLAGLLPQRSRNHADRRRYVPPWIRR